MVLRANLRVTWEKKVIKITRCNIHIIFCLFTSFEPPHEKPTKWLVRPTKTPISLGIHPVWSVSSLCAVWVASSCGQRRLWSASGQMSGLIWVFAGHKGHFLVFVVFRLILWNTLFWIPEKGNFIKVYFPKWHYFHDTLFNNNFIRDLTAFHGVIGSKEH